MTLDLKDRLYTSSEVAEILGVSLRSVYRYIEEGKLDADIKTATGRHRFSKKNILDFLKPNETEYSRINNLSQDISQDFDFNHQTNTSQNNNLKNSLADSNKDDDFDFDLDEEFLKSISFDNNLNNPTPLNNQSNSSSSQNSSSFDDFDDLEKLLKEFEEEEQRNINKSNVNDLTSDYDFSSNSSMGSSKYQDNSVKKPLDSFEDMSLDEILNSFENSLSNKPNNLDINTNKVANKENENLLSSNKDNSSPAPLKDFDFDFDFDFDELNDASKGVNNTFVKQQESPLNHIPKANVEEEEDNWLERFRKAASKNNSVQVTNQEPEKSDSVDFSFQNPFSNKTGTVSSLSTSFDIGSSFKDKNQINESQPSIKNIENYYTSTLNDLREVAQQVDKIAKKFDTDYAFTLNAGLSLHKRIEPFTCIHLYIRERDLELFEDYLDLTPSKTNEASVCLIISKDGDVFEDAYELHGLYVVSNVQLRSDLIDKGLDKLAREV